MTARILVVDDEVSMLRSVERVLQSEYDVRSTSSPAEAVELANTFRPHLAIVDIRMPEMDGFELMNELKHQDETIEVILMTGSIYDVDEHLIRAIREKAFYYITKPFDRDVLRTLVRRCMELRLLAEANRRYMEHLEHQLAEARAFQEAMLPAAEAQLEGFEIHAAYRPSAELAGDLYDYAAVGPGRLALLIGDVAGHGASAAMLTSIVKSVFHSSHAAQYDPRVVVRRVAEGIAAFEAHRFVTLLCARISQPEGVLEYVNAGHLGGLLARPDGTSLSLDATGPLVSPAFPHLEWERKTLPWDPQSLVVLYTDGIPEASCEEEPFGVQRIHSVVQRHVGGRAELLQAILGDVERFTRGRPAADDMTLLTARCA
jgi:sigma-B regulation protein RsbU (phosphoserine phosphatase)